MRAVLARPLRAFSSAAAAMQWGPGKAKAACSWTQKIKPRTPWLLILGPRLPWRGQDGNVRRSARTMRASSLHAHGCASNEPRPVLANRRRRRGIRGAFSLVTFSCATKRKSPARWTRAEKRRDAPANYDSTRPTASLPSGCRQSAGMTGKKQSERQRYWQSVV